MLSNGVDIIEIGRIEEALGRFGERFLKRVYTDAEIDLYRKSNEALAARFSGKEAVMKTLGLKYLPWKDIEILPDPKGKPLVFPPWRRPHLRSTPGASLNRQQRSGHKRSSTQPRQAGRSWQIPSRVRRPNRRNVPKGDTSTTRAETPPQS